MLNMDFKKIAQEFPRKFWSVVGVSFIDRVGGTMLFPFFALYITQKFHVGMTQAGVVLGLFSVFGLVGQMIGGALTDKFGRRKLIIFGLVFSAISTLAFGFINTFSALIPLAIGVGLLSDIAGPAHAAMIADILPENQRQEGFGILRVVGNLAWIFGPTIGGFVAGNPSLLSLLSTRSSAAWWRCCSTCSFLKPNRRISRARNQKACWSLLKDISRCCVMGLSSPLWLPAC